MFVLFIYVETYNIKSCNAVEVLLRVVNPCCISDNKLFDDRKLYNCLCTNFSKSSPDKANRLIGRQFVTNCLSLVTEKHLLVICYLSMLQRMICLYLLLVFPF